MTTLAEYIPGTAAYEVRREVERTTQAALTGEIECIPVTSEMHRIEVAATARTIVAMRRQQRDQVAA